MTHVYYVLFCVNTFPEDELTSQMETIQFFNVLEEVFINEFLNLKNYIYIMRVYILCDRLVVAYGVCIETSILQLAV